MRERPTEKTPTRREALVFRTKAAAFQAERVRRATFIAGPRRHRKGRSLVTGRALAESSTPLWYALSPSERALEAGKVHNLRLAARALDGVEVPAGSTFSFWTQIGRLTRRRGYVDGRELREGCVVPAVGGGICQLSNALFDAADRAGLEIVERHRHSRVVAGSLAEIDRDATVFWNYVDLRFRGADAFRLEVRLTRESLVVRIRGSVLSPAAQSPPDAPERCALRATANRAREHACFRKAALPTVSGSFGRQALVVDDVTPELRAYAADAMHPNDVMALPLDGRALGISAYEWLTTATDVRQAPLVTAWRSLASRRLAAQGAERQRTLLAFDERLARALARALTFDVTHVIVAQTLLPHLWRMGHLGGRTFDVLATRLPLYLLHERLDAARAVHPESKTIGDYRADAALVDDELEALDNARRIVTSHSEIARAFGDRAVKLEWVVPEVGRRHDPGELLAFAGPTAARKGAFEVRELAHALDATVAVSGSLLEGPDFWRDVRYERCLSGGDWLSGAAAVVAPSWVEHRPRKLLDAVARGVPVIASEACGLAGVDGVLEVPTGDVRALRNAVRAVLDSRRPALRTA